MTRRLALAAGCAALAAAVAAPRAARAGHKVFLNASDQTTNPVACGGNEAQYAADSAQRAKTKLQAAGFSIMYSQDFYNSPSMANNWGAERFLSFHTNAGGGHGTETLYKSTVGKTFAGHVNNGLVAKLGFANRGLKYRDNLHVLNATNMPAALTESLFHDCTTTHATPIGSMSEACFLTKSAGRDLIATGAANGICTHFGVSCQAAPPPPPPAPVYDASAGAHDYPATMNSGDEAVVWFEFVNKGNQTWDLDKTRLGTQDPQDRASGFYVDGNWLSPNRATGADHSNYGPGATGRFTFAVRAPEVTTETEFVETFELVQEGVTWFGPKVTMTVTVKPLAAPPPPAPAPDAAPPPPGEADAGPDLPPVDPGELPSEEEDGGSMSGSCRVAAGHRPAGPPAVLGLALLLVGAALARRRR